MDIFDKLRMEIAVKELEDVMSEYETVTEAIAIQMQIYFKALVKVGFTEEQAFELVKEHGANIGKLM